MRGAEDANEREMEGFSREKAQTNAKTDGDVSRGVAEKQRPPGLNKAARQAPLVLSIHDRASLNPKRNALVSNRRQKPAHGGPPKRPATSSSIRNCAAVHRRGVRMKRTLVLSFRRVRTLATVRFSFPPIHRPQYHAQQGVFRRRPGAATLPAMGDAQGIAASISTERCPACSIRATTGSGQVESVRIFAHWAQRMRCGRNSWNIEGFPFPRHRARTAAHELRQFVIPDAAKQTDFIVSPPFPMRNG